MQLFVQPCRPWLPQLPQRAHWGRTCAHPDAPGEQVEELLEEHTMNHLSDFRAALAESLGPWTFQHSIGTALILVFAVGIAIWQQLAGSLP
jgi:hypothetical protein